MKGHINIAGGEPLCSPYFFKILDLIKKDADIISFSILTNGTLITGEIAKKIKSYNPEYVQVSLEGGKKTNNYIRGKGTSISFTATKLNYKEFSKVVKYARRYITDRF